MMVASLVLPASLYSYASWVSYRDTHEVADERIGGRSTCMQEQTLKVFETVDRTFAEVDEVVHGMSDDHIRAAQPTLHPRLQEITQTMPQLQAIVLISRDGQPLASSALATVKPGANFADRDYFKAQLDRDVGTYVSDVRTPNLAVVGSDFFDLSRRLARAGSSRASSRWRCGRIISKTFTACSARRRTAASSRWCATTARSWRVFRRAPAIACISSARRAGCAPPSRKVTITANFTVNSEVDGVPRRVGFRKLAELSGLRAGGHQCRRDQPRMAHGHGSASDLRLAGDLAGVRRAVDCAPPHATAHDEAQRREMAEDALHQAQQLQAIGQLTGGVAHDFNNLLMIVSGSVQRLRRVIKDDKQTHLLDAITNATERGESFTRQLLTFSRRQTLQPSVIDLADRLPEIKEMLSRSLRGDIDIRVGVPRRPCASRSIRASWSWRCSISRSMRGTPCRRAAR